MSPREALQQFFGHETFLEGQEEVVSRIHGGENLCVIMPTGAGKSLCYQLPALMADGYTLVISPLISLMKDQVDALVERGIAAAFVNSTLSRGEQQRVLAEVATGAVKLLYVSPERLRLPGFRALVRRTPPELLVVDEAHCISQWGHDFRPDYARIGAFVDELRVPRACAFTATATPVVREDITRQMHRPRMGVFVSGFTRPNLAFAVRRVHRADEKLRILRELLAVPKPTIIYASTRKNVDLLVAALGCISYHAGMPDEARIEAQERFMNDPCPVVAATNAFGMGIDRADVRRVVHFNIPGSLEAYYQEAGRAGRDGEDAECLLLYSYQDRYIHEFLIEMSHPPEDVVFSTYSTLLQLARERENNHLEIGVAELAGLVRGAKGDQQVSAALKILERNGYLMRGYRQQNRGLLRRNREADQFLARFPSPTTQRAVFLHRVGNYYGGRLSDGVACTVGELSGIAGLNGEQTRRVLRALNGHEIAWVPPFSGRSITLTRPEEPHPLLDFTELNHERELETRRLGDMLAYPSSRSCRQQHIISYFGQQTDGWHCQVCDRCREEDVAEKRLPTDREQVVLQTLLQAVTEVNGRFGRNKIAKLVAGSRSLDILNGGLHRCASYGALTGEGQPRILKLLESLTDAGCLDIVGDSRYPCLKITSRGRAVMNGDETVALAFHSFTGAPSPSRAGAGSRRRGAAPAVTDTALGVAGDDLYEALRTLRNEMAAKRRLKPYQILSNETLRELAEQRPQTVEEARGIRGIGPKRSRTVLPAFLAAISQWRGQSVAAAGRPADL